MKVKYKQWFKNINIKIVDGKNITELKDTYILLFKEFEKSELPNLSKHDRLNIVNNIETIEFKMQELFGFEKNRDFHSYWNDIEYCECPLLDNIDNFGTPYRDIVLECQFHGTEIINLNNRMKKLKRILE